MQEQSETEQPVAKESAPVKQEVQSEEVEQSVPEQQTMQESAIFTRMANEELQDPMFTAADLEMA